MYWILLIKTPNYTNKKYKDSKIIYNNNIKDFHKRFILLKTSIANNFSISLINFDKSLIASFNNINPTKIFSLIDNHPTASIKGTNLSLYANYNPKTSDNKLGYKNKEKAIFTVNKIKNKPIKYQLYVISTMLGRAKNHPNQTKDMKEAITVFTKWLNNYHSSK